MVKAEEWRKFYNKERPHLFLGMLAPKGFAMNQSPKDTFHREIRGDIYDRYSPIYIFNSKYSNLINPKKDFIPI